MEAEKIIFPPKGAEIKKSNTSPEKKQSSRFVIDPDTEQTVSIPSNSDEYIDPLEATITKPVQHINYGEYEPPSALELHELEPEKIDVHLAAMATEQEELEDQKHELVYEALRIADEPNATEKIAEIDRTIAQIDHDLRLLHKNKLFADEIYPGIYPDTTKTAQELNDLKNNLSEFDELSLEEQLTRIIMHQKKYRQSELSYRYMGALSANKVKNELERGQRLGELRYLITYFEDIIRHRSSERKNFISAAPSQTSDTDLLTSDEHMAMERMQALRDIILAKTEFADEFENEKSLSLDTIFENILERRSSITREEFDRELANIDVNIFENDYKKMPVQHFKQLYEMILEVANSFDDMRDDGTGDLKSAQNARKLIDIGRDYYQSTRRNSRSQRLRRDAI